MAPQQIGIDLLADTPTQVVMFAVEPSLYFVNWVTGQSRGGFQIAQGPERRVGRAEIVFLNHAMAVG